MSQPLPSDTFAMKLRAERARQGMSQAALAEAMAQFLGTRIDPTAITRIEQQSRAVRLDEAVAMATALGVTLTDLTSSQTEGETEKLIEAHVAELAEVRAKWDALGERMQYLTTQIEQLRSRGPAQS